VVSWLANAVFGYSVTEVMSEVGTVFLRRLETM
jgi:hypothetical protein